MKQFTFVIKITLFISFSLFTFLNSQSSPNSQTKIYELNGKKYISALEFAKIQKVQTIFYEDKEKLEFRFPNFKVLVSPHSSFVRINEIIHHMYLPVIYDGNDFFL